MPKLASLFVQQVYESQRRFTPWPPNVPVAVGDVGVLSDGVFEARTDLASLGIPFKSGIKSSGTIIDFSSSEGVSVLIQGRGTGEAGAARANAHATVSFDKTGGAVLQASGVAARVIGNLQAVGTVILERFSAGLWEEDWVLVTEAQKAEHTTVLVSQGRSAKLELEAEGEVAGEVPLAAGFKATKKVGAIVSYIGRDSLTPLFALARVKEGWLSKLFGHSRGKLVAARRAVGAPAASAGPVLEAVEIAQGKANAKRLNAASQRGSRGRRR